jgi:hypothetical protein
MTQIFQMEKVDNLEVIYPQSDDETHCTNDCENSCSGQTCYNHSLTYGLGSANNQYLTGESKTSILEDVYTFDFQAKYFLEQ